MHAVRLLLDSVLDYAGLFPPAKLDMQPTVSNYARYMKGPDAWMLARLIVPVTRFPEFVREADPLLPKTADVEGTYDLSLVEGSITTPDDADMAAAYRRCGHYEERHEQMHLLRELGLGLDRYVRSRLITATFKMAARPARMAGLGGLYDFMARGFAVMKPMKSVADFLDLFIGREARILDNLAQGHEYPFEFAHETTT